MFERCLSLQGAPGIIRSYRGINVTRERSGPILMRVNGWFPDAPAAIHPRPAYVCPLFYSLFETAGGGDGGGVWTALDI